MDPVAAGGPHLQRRRFHVLGELIEFGNVNRMFKTPSDPRTQRFIAGRFG